MSVPAVRNSVVIVTPEPVSGAAEYVARLALSLLSVGTRLTLLCPNQFEFAAILTQSGVNVCYSGIRDVRPANSKFKLLSRNLGYLIRSTLAQMKLVKSGDIVHFQFPLYFPPGLLPFLAAKFRGCPVVFTVHDPLPHKWLLPVRLRFLEQSALRIAYSISNTLIVHNETGKTMLRERFGQPDSKIEIIPHGPFTQQKATGDWPEGAVLRLLAFGSIRQNKGTHLAILATQQINSQGVIRASLTIAGTVANARERDYWTGCLKQIEIAPQGIEVREGYVDAEAVPAMVSGHHALILPYEDFLSESGVASLALSNKRPIIATSSGGLGPLLEAGCGIPIKEFSKDAVVDAIEQAILICGSELKKIGENSYAFIMGERSWDSIAAKTALVYSALVQKNSQSSSPVTEHL